MTDTVEGDAEPLEPAPRPSKDATRNTVEWVLIVIGALLVALVVKTFLIQAFFIPSLSMYSTLDEGDRVLVNKLSYRLGDIDRGDIVVFERPDTLPESAIKDLIKRVIGLPGDVLEGRDGQVYVNGKRLEEDYLDEGVTTTGLERQTVPEGHIFVMGDNRENSDDSRGAMGPIDQDLVVGRAFVRVWPLPDVHLL